VFILAVEVGLQRGKLIMQPAHSSLQKAKQFEKSAAEVLRAYR
jgi:hypothetical protein